MILVANDIGSAELRDIIRRYGVNCERQELDYADACFEGNGPDGQVLIGIERKKIDDILKCVDTGRLSGHQAVGMRRMYRFKFVLVEGVWKPDTRTGLLLEERVKPDRTVFWSYQRPGGGRVMYAKLRRFLFSVQMSGIPVIYTRDIAHTCYDIVELYHWFQKRWREHTSMEQMHRGYSWQHETKHHEELMVIPSISRKPPLVRRWAAELDGVGVKLSADAQRIFRTPLDLANADEGDWVRIPGVTMPHAKKIVKQIIGK